MDEQNEHETPDAAATLVAVALIVAALCAGLDDHPFLSAAFLAFLWFV
jgi:hypothetical protein